MDRIFLENFRCFRNRQEARLAPLTLLVGENSTGKTAFLAIIRALWEVAFQDAVPDFREEPYDLGTFRDVAHNRGGRGGQARFFEAGFEKFRHRLANRRTRRLVFNATFEERGAFPFPVKRVFERGGIQVAVEALKDRNNVVNIKTPSKEYQFAAEDSSFLSDDMQLFPLRAVLGRIAVSYRRGRLQSSAEPDSISLPDEDANIPFSDAEHALLRSLTMGFPRRIPFAGAPVRSRPRRTYDPTRPWQDPAGVYIPTYLASIFHRDPDKWQSLKEALENFGQESGLFDELSIKSLGRTEGSPFQVQVRKFSGRLKGPQRNLIDVGYGVSQVLPVLTELLDPDSPDMFLLQQPEVHLHPSAQAALGGLFCSIAEKGRQVIVETHSDYLLDRVRMDIRDKKTALKPEDVSILYFEPGELEVKIHSLRLDELGNVLDAPPGYGQFFMDETRRSIGL